MGIEKLKSGSYRISKMQNGIRYRTTIDHKPTKSEMERILSELVIDYENPKFSKACEFYLESKSNLLSPSTIRSYRMIMSKISPAFMNTPIRSIRFSLLQNEINKYSVGHSPKTTRNFNGFIMTVLKFYDIDIKTPTLPQKEKKSPYIPTKDEVSAIFKAAKGTKYEVAFFLASMGLRRSEICGATLSDLDGNILTINKALVLDENKEWVLKTTKTTDSTRTIVLPDEIIETIRKQGYVYEGHPGMISKMLNEYQKKLGIERFSLHKLRHFFASYLHDLGYSNKQIQEIGGWKTDYVLKAVYQHAMDAGKAKSEIALKIGDLL